MQNISLEERIKEPAQEKNNNHQRQNNKNKKSDKRILTLKQRNNALKLL
jgi:hypothetical protein